MKLVWHGYRVLSTRQGIGYTELILEGWHQFPVSMWHEHFHGYTGKETRVRIYESMWSKANNVKTA